MILHPTLQSIRLCNRLCSSLPRILRLNSKSQTLQYRLIASHIIANMKPIQPVTLKLDTPEFKSILSDELEALVKMFQKHNHEIRIAGGAVRDLLMGHVPHDVDFATTATPEEMKEMFGLEGIRMINNNGEKHGTITARMNDKDNFECTTLRIDINTDGRHAEVQWTREWQLDALRRDLTVNSLFLGFDGTVYDYFNGIEDLKQKRIRFVGSASERIQEDYLRIMRYFRFFGRVVEDADSHEPSTLQEIKDNVHGLAQITGERLWVEFKKILTGRHSKALLPVMFETGVTTYLGLTGRLDFESYSLVCDHSEGLEPHPTTRLAALITETEQLEAVHERMKMSNDEKRNALFILQNRHSALHGADVTRSLTDLYWDTVGKESKSRARIEELLKYRGDRDTLNVFSDLELPKLPVNGVDLFDVGVPKGPSMAIVLNKLRDIYKESNYSTSRAQLLESAKDIYESMPPPKKVSKKSKTSKS